MWTGIGIGVLCVGALAAYYIVMDLVQVPNVNLPNVVGKPETTAIQSIENAGIARNQIHLQTAANSQQKKGDVYSQSPQGSEQVKQTADIYLYISDGPKKIQVPTLKGMPADQAKTTLTNDGFPHVTDKAVQSADVPVGDVVDSNPPANATVSPDTPIVLEVSQGSETQVPNVLGQTLSQATTALDKAHLTVGQVSQIPFPGGQDGNVVKQFPASNQGDKVPAGTPVDLWVANNSGSVGNSTGNSTGNGTGNATGVPGNLPPDTHVRPVTIRVPDQSGKSIQVQIVKSDAISTDQQVVNQTITKATTWTVTMYLTPDSQGEVQVYENGKLKQDYPVQY